MIPFDSMEAMQENEQIFRTIREKKLRGERRARR